ncbi:MAG: ABC transporter substrate-binding protein [Chloroflexi bacterium]|nr:ABC transporter substrate-binding protein [Chloroflexota bacterium]
MVRRRRLWIAAAVVAVISLALASCAPAGGPGAKPSGGAPQPSGPVKPAGTLSVAINDIGVGYFLPIVSSVDKPHWSALYDYLTYMDKDNKLLPGLATKWEVSPDAKKWTFQLRKGVQFHKGKGELTSADVKGSIELIVAKDSQGMHSSRFRDIIEGVDAPDPATAVIRLKKQQPDLPILMSSYFATAIISTKNFEAVGKEAAEKNPIGSGPFQFIERTGTDYMKFEAVEDHWRKTPEFKNLVLRKIPELTTRIAMLKTGQADVIDIEALSKPEMTASGFRVVRGPLSYSKGIHLQGMWFIPGVHQENFDANNPFVKKEVRQALNLAIDRNAIVKDVFAGEAVAASVSTLLPNSPGWNPNWKPYPYDPEKAKKLLADAGYAKGLELKLTLDKREYLAQIGEAVAMYWEKVGVKAKMDYGDWAGGLRALAVGRKNPGIAWAHRQIYSPEWDLQMTLYWWSKGLAGFVEHPVLEEIMVKLPTVTDQKSREELIRKAGDFIYDNYFWVPVIYDAPIYALNKRVGDWTNNMPMMQLTNLVNFEYAKRTE